MVFLPTDMREYNKSDEFNSSRTQLFRCALQYVLLHLLGYQLTMDDLKAFRQIDSKTPGHPECGHTDGIC